MKFYYLPHPNGFVSFSKNHYAIYNEKQEAKLLERVTIDDVNYWISLLQSNSSISINIDQYHKNKLQQQELHNGYQQNKLWNIK